MLEFEVSADRNNFIDLQIIFLEIEYKIVHIFEADLKCDASVVRYITESLIYK